jgi:mono/diheme cytochrome c family protein
MKSFLAWESLRCFGLAWLAATCLVASAHAQSPRGNAARGQALAESVCTECHVVVRNGPAGWTDAPSFAAIAARPDSTAARLQAIMERPHMHMMYLPRSRSEAADLAAYILSLKQPQ